MMTSGFLMVTLFKQKRLPSTHFARSCGFTLVELMVVMVVVVVMATFVGLGIKQSDEHKISTFAQTLEQHIKRMQYLAVVDELPYQLVITQGSISLQKQLPTHTEQGFHLVTVESDPIPDDIVATSPTVISTENDPSTNYHLHFKKGQQTVIDVYIDNDGNVTYQMS